ncbi:ABC-type transport auxiliary lipoprotein family protein [Chitinispirillales bacterium ANBcel5]|uniref:ABC-type transport auxiliary lipoprotein family protein n=1 Tax=Cellulosispirillum alkaliphilum TaxID=3039283 RepID=UPI002A5776F3|nr:ABC-type transport auxiliary lipoprotein family protein [Chitinispirillales bacterium ANBcel5]
MIKNVLAIVRFVVPLIALIHLSCARVPLKHYYTLNYTPNPMPQRILQEPYPYIIRLREFSIEEAYNRPQIVYRLSPFELQYYVYRVWAVRPTRMITDLVFKHLTSTNLVSSVVRRFDEGRRPDYELSGMIEALEEYDSEDISFAHLALRIELTRLSDGANIYNRHFDLRKRVYQQEPKFVVRELSSIMEYIMTQALQDIDKRLARELGLDEGKIQDITETSSRF